ncbi:glycerol-3-phosphate dehydrogenase/oxidase [Mucilaginibacter aquariorum]|uniref:Glycerol-3-phosphate dehydrogenase/oxidase n=1 Tax=Mucilaginibacter aquariorum TaxID=2967225 RepID=A0ABT1SXQ7_9SPHI|nr:glycerol-3-phosphate dehydrogenase/oxidase [Mucilaginibacter aquariorum]MCQ6957131.1 glycerol-3-phosphate dehydrogenase/oxidase [Mucilaginibacter aquariorum]
MNLFKRERNLLNIADTSKTWDFIIIGGGATGLGATVDAASRGYSTLLLEQADFAKGTSSRATKLVHGGVRYLAQGYIGLVREALRERGLLLKNAPHLVKNESFIIPNYNWWGGLFYTIGLTVYDILAGKLSFGRAKHLSKKETLKRLPGLKENGLRGGVVYYDGQFDDSRLAVNLAQTAMEQGATLLNYFKVIGLLKNTDGHLSGVTASDIETGESYQLKALVIVNATGVFVDDILKMDAPDKKTLIRPSQGVHLVLDRSFLPAEDALMIPKTEDGRVLFAVPWHGKLLVGTTDTPIESPSLEPVALDAEVEFILRTAGKYLTKTPTRPDVLSVFAGLRPLAAPQNGSSKTKEISRSHKLIVSESGLLTMTGGKWTTYRKMGEDIVDKAIETGGLKSMPCKTAGLPIHGSRPNPDRNNHLFVYGTDIEKVLALYDENPDWKNPVHAKDNYTKGEVIWSVRNEMARTVEDILARRTRVLFLNARLAIEMAPEVARLMASELKKDTAWEREQVEAFYQTAKNYVLSSALK